MKHIKLLIIIISALGAFGVYSFVKNKLQKKYDVTTVTLQQGDIKNGISATGTIEPVVEVNVGTQISGIIDNIYVDYNSVVKKGQILAEMDKSTLQSEYNSSLANYNSNKSEFSFQEKNYMRNKKLHDKELISDLDYEISLNSYLRAKSALEQSQAALYKAEKNLSYATITSPIDGIITSKLVEEGQTVASVFSTPILFTIAADLKKVQIAVDVDEADIAGVRPGNKVEFYVDAYPNEIFYGIVRNIYIGSDMNTTGNTITDANSVVTYEVVVETNNAGQKLIPRMTANTTIYTQCKSGVQVLPNQALRFNPMDYETHGYAIKDCTSQYKVWTLKEDSLIAIPVQLGGSDNINTEIISGINVNDAVVCDINTVK